MNEAGSGLATGRVPSQRRSRERVERILAVAAERIGAAGSEALTMSEVAAGAGISIGSLYQYFPDKSAIILALARRQHAEGRRCIEAGLADVTDRDGLVRAFSELLSTYRTLFAEQPVMRDIAAAMAADKALAALEIAESRAAGALLAKAMRRALPGKDPARVEAAAFLAWQLGEAAMRLVLAVEASEGDRLIAGYERMALAIILDP
jgi:AcrR family transcriptional regulator